MLRVVQAFGDHVVGESITDAEKVAAVLASDQAAFVVSVADDPAPVKPTAKSDMPSAS